MVYYLQWSDLVGGYLRDVRGPDADDGLLGAAAYWRASENLFQKSRLTQAAQRHTQQSPNPESWRHLPCRACMCEVFFFCFPFSVFPFFKENIFWGDNCWKPGERGRWHRAFPPCTMKCCTGCLTSANQLQFPLSVRFHYLFKGGGRRGLQTSTCFKKNTCTLQMQNRRVRNSWMYVLYLHIIYQFELIKSKLLTEWR